MTRTLPVHLSNERPKKSFSFSYHAVASSLAFSPTNQRQASTSGDQRQGTRDTDIDICVGVSVAPFSEFNCLKILKESIKLKSLCQTKKIYAYIVLLTAEPAIILQEHLVLAFAKLGGIDDAQSVFNKLPRRSAFPWTGMIDGFVDYNKPYDGITMYQCMQLEGVEPDRFTFISLFKACGRIGDLQLGKELHIEAQLKNFATNTFVSNTLISMYGKCGDVSEAQNLFYELAVRSVVSWTAMIAVYVENNLAERGLLLCRQMLEEGLSPNDQTFVGAIQACSVLAELEDAWGVDGQSIKAVYLEIGQAFHVEAFRAGFCSDAYVVTTLISMYGKCGALAEAEAVFSSLGKRSVGPWTAMISAYTDNGCKEKALLLYRKMLEEGVSPNEHTLVCVLQACDAFTGKDCFAGGIKQDGSWEFGQALHADAQINSLVSEEFLGNALISMYGRHGFLKEAENVFLGLSQRSVVSWTAMQSAYIEQGKPERALQIYTCMYEQGVSPNEQTLVVALQACSTIAVSKLAVPATSQADVCLQICQCLHKDAERIGVVSDVIVGSALLTLYAKCRALPQAEDLFLGLPVLDTGSWNAMIASCVEQDHKGMAFDLYRSMLEENGTPDDITLLTVLQASSKACILRICLEIHFNVASCAHDSNELLSSSLLNAYGTCLDVSDAEIVLLGALQPDIVSWNSYIGSHAAAGNSEASAHILDTMILTGMQPDRITFGLILSACNHSGLLEEGICYFLCMCEFHCLKPDSKHFASVVDLLGRVGAFERLENVLWRLPTRPDLAIWLSVLGSCCNHNNMELGRLAFFNALRLQLNDILEYDAASLVY